MAQKVNRRGLFGLFAKGAVAAPFVGKAMMDAAQAEMTPAGISKAHLAEEHAAVYGRAGDPSGLGICVTLSCTMGPYTDMRFSDEDRAILEHHCDDENCWCFDEDADF